MSTHTIIFVVDGCGIGGAPDAEAWGTRGANTLGHTASTVGGLHVPTLTRWGLGNLTALDGVGAVTAPDAHSWAAVEASAGNDTPTGHWELFGRITHTAPATFPNGFDPELQAELRVAFGVDELLGNMAIGGLAALEHWGGESVRTGNPIVYTSSDSVLQIAAHVDVVGLDRLYEWCEHARRICDDRWPVGRIIARPFNGMDDRWVRLSAQRRDWCRQAPSDNAVDRLHTGGTLTAGVGKIGDIFTHRGFNIETHPDTYLECVKDAAVLSERWRGEDAVIIVNLAEFDYRGHARDPEGFAAAFERFDTALGDLETTMVSGDRVVICADHGNDPTFTHTNTGAPTVDHTRERTPLLVNTIGVPGGYEGECAMGDLGASLTAWYQLDPVGLDGEPLSV